VRPYRWQTFETATCVVLPNLKGVIMPGIELITAERQRQVEKEGFDSEHDDQHHNDLALAAGCYVDHVVGRAWVVSDPDLGIDAYQMETLPDNWPDDWDEKYWKPTRPVRDLVKAGALIAAEIDRRLRAGESV
jgi:hypothetical protein